MPGYIIHLTEAKIIIEQLTLSGYHFSQEWINLFYLGCLLPDTKRKRAKESSHFWDPNTLDDLAIPPDMELFLDKYKQQMRGPLMLGYYTHLKLDECYVKEYWKDHFDFRDTQGNPAIKSSDITQVRLHKTDRVIPVKDFFSRQYYYGDYCRLNKPLRDKYAITPPQYPSDCDPICPIQEVEVSDLKDVLRELAEILTQEEIYEKEPLQILDQETIEDFIARTAAETCTYIKDHLYLLALDLDGTLLPSSKNLTPRSLQALGKSIACGDQIVVASGRPFSSLPQDVMSIPDLAYAMASNGASVFSCRSQIRVLHNCISADSAGKAIRLLQSQGKHKDPAAIEVIIDGIPYCFADYVRNPQNYGCQGSGITYIQSTRKSVEDIYAFSTQHIHELEAIDIITASPDEKSHWLLQLASIPGLYITSSIAHLIEVSSAQSGKGQSLKALAEHMGHSRDRIIAFGNEENDIDMLQYAGCGVAVANSSPVVLAIADHITASNDEEGVAAFLDTVISDLE